MAKRYGRQTPTYEIVGKYAYTDGEQATALASEFWDAPLEWQQHFLDVMLARDKRDKYAFKTVGLSLARQNGKSWSVRARCFYGLIADGEKILYTCQHGDTADGMFKELSAPFEDEENEDLNDLLDAVRKTNGQQAIYLKNGGYIRFTTRTNNLARGKSYDVVIYDEAQELTREQQDASRFVTSASKKHNAQVIYLGTPPNEKAPAEVFKPLHDRVHDGDTKGTAWLEWAVEEVGDTHEVDRWYETNPSLGYLIDEETIAAEADDVAPDSFARERLGWWAKAGVIKTAIDPDIWRAARIKSIGDKYKKKTTFGVRFSNDGSIYALVGCKQNKDGEFAVELVEVGTTERGTRSLAEEIVNRKQTVNACMIDGLNGAEALCTNLAELKAPRGYITRPNTADVIAASQSFLDGLTDGTIKHTYARAFDNSALGCVRRSIGSRGGWGFGSTDAADSTITEAAALAVWCCKNTRRNPRRKQRIL